MFNIYFPSRLYLRKGILTLNILHDTHAWRPCLSVLQLSLSRYHSGLSCFSFPVCGSFLIPVVTRIALQAKWSYVSGVSFSHQPPRELAMEGCLCFEREHLPHGSGDGGVGRGEAPPGPEVGSQICFGPRAIRNMEPRGLNGSSQVTHS